MKILVAEEDKNIAQYIEKVLIAENMECQIISGKEVLKANNFYQYDMILLGALPSKSYEMVFHLRSANVKAPILILADLPGVATNQNNVKLSNDNNGDIPFKLQNLVQRIQRALKQTKEVEVDVLFVDKNITIDRKDRNVKVSGEVLDLTGKEFSVLEILAEKPGQVITKEEILRIMYNGVDEPAGKIIDVFVSNVRRKIRRASGVNYIATAYGRGYSFDKDAA